MTILQHKNTKITTFKILKIAVAEFSVKITKLTNFMQIAQEFKTEVHCSKYVSNQLCTVYFTIFFHASNL